MPGSGPVLQRHPWRAEGPDTEPSLFSGCLAGEWGCYKYQPRAGDLGNARPLPVLWLERYLAPNKVGTAERRCHHLDEKGLGKKSTQMPGPFSSLGSPWVCSSDLLPGIQLGSTGLTGEATAVCRDGRKDLKEGMSLLSR